MGVRSAASSDELDDVAPRFMCFPFLPRPLSLLRFFVLRSSSLELEELLRRERRGRECVRHTHTHSQKLHNRSHLDDATSRDDVDPSPDSSSLSYSLEPHSEYSPSLHQQSAADTSVQTQTHKTNTHTYTYTNTHTHTHTHTYTQVTHPTMRTCNHHTDSSAIACTPYTTASAEEFATKAAETAASPPANNQ